MGNEAPTALGGLLVLESCAWVGGSATMLLADMGARVIKIEPMGKGDPGRGFLGRARYVGGKKQYPKSLFDSIHRNKEAITLNLEKEEGRQVFYRLVKKSDVFVHNYRLGVAEKLGVDYPTLKPLNPRLIYAWNSGFGPKGVESTRPGLDVLVAFRTAFTSMLGEPGSPPQLPQTAMIDHVAPVLLTCGILAALHHREVTGRGQEVSTSLLGGSLFIQTQMLTEFLFTGVPPGRISRSNTELVNTYKCKDGEWLVTCLVPSDQYWPDLCRGLDISGTEKDPRFVGFENRYKNAIALTSMLDEIFQKKTRSEWLSILRDRLQLPIGPVNSFEDVLRDPQVLENQYIVDYEASDGRRVKALRTPIDFGETPVEIRTTAPQFGQHTEEVLINVAGYTWNEIEALKDNGVI